MHGTLKNNQIALDAPHRKMCTDCGISRTNAPERCGHACQFIKPNYKDLELRVHGRSRSDYGQNDEGLFGVFEHMYRASLKHPRDGAQWTGITSEIGKRLLESGKVDAVIAVRPDEHDRWKPVPVLITEADDMVHCRGMRMGFAPTLSLLEPAIEAGYRRIGIIGIPCQIYALRAIEESLGLERLYVIGTPCSDNTTTQNFHLFLKLLSDQPDEITYLEFKADYHVELRFKSGERKTIPFLKLPISELPSDFFPLTCQTCVDYTNTLADLTVGYMAGEGEQWLIVRNQRGQELIDALGEDLLIAKPGSKGNRKRHVEGFKQNVERSAGGLPVRRMPSFVRPIAAWLMPKIGPKGLEFARARVEMKALETVLHLRTKAPARIKNMVPEHVWQIVSQYGLKRSSGE